VAINCAAIPDSLLEATLFGYEKGAFTGAQQAQAGKFEQAQEGTLLLDEVTEMPLTLQAKLLRVLQEREVERVGGKKPVALNIRLIATSNRDMAEAVAKGVLREDVYYRLNVFPLLIPALRQRPDDIVPLATRFLAEHGARSGRNGLFLAPSAEQALRQYAWPGNVRELENVMQRAVILATGDTVEAEALRLAVPPIARSASPSHAPPAPAETPKIGNMRDLEREHILETLTAAGGSRKLTGERLGMSERTLRHKLKQYRDAGWLKE
jgi:two-component system response regulator FlrC